MPVEIEMTRMGEQKVPAEHEVESPVEEGQLRQCCSDVAAVSKMLLEVGQEALRRCTPVGFGSVDGSVLRTRVSARSRLRPRPPGAKPASPSSWLNAPPPRPQLGGGLGTVGAGPLGERVQPRPVERVDGHRIRAAATCFRDKGRGSSTHIEHGLAAKRGQIECKVLCVAFERSAGKRDRR